MTKTLTIIKYMDNLIITADLRNITMSTKKRIIIYKNIQRRNIIKLKRSVKYYAVKYKVPPSTSITDLISRIVQVLKGDLYWVKINAQKAGLIEPVEPQDKG